VAPVGGRHFLVPSFSHSRKKVVVVLVKLGAMEQRHQAGVQGAWGASVTEYCAPLWGGRQTMQGLLRRYASDGLARLVDRSCKPDSCPHRTPVQIEAKLWRYVELMRGRPGHLIPLYGLSFVSSWRSAIT